MTHGKASFRMQPQASAAPEPICLAHGYGLKIHVRYGHLIVEEGVGRARQTRRYGRAHGCLERLVVIGHTGYVTLDALRWIRDIGAAFVQLDSDGSLVTVAGPTRPIDARLIRAQAAAAENGAGRRLMVQALRSKIDQQALLVRERLGNPSLAARRRTPYATLADGISAQAAKLDPSGSVREIRYIESVAGKYYWNAWATVPVRFHHTLVARAPDHWATAGRRVAQDTRPRRAPTPPHAILNYLYAILEAEATLAARAHGLEPRLGIFHADRGFHDALSADLMESARPVAERIALELLEHHAFCRGELQETREGVCRIGPPLARQLATHAPALRAAVAPHVERLARTLLKAPEHATRSRDGGTVRR